MSYLPPFNLFVTCHDGTAHSVRDKIIRFQLTFSLVCSAEEYKALVTDSQEPVVVDFFAEWCGPCKAIAPAIEKFSETHGHVKFYKVDVDNLSDVAADNGVSAMPTFLFYKNGELVDTVRGANPPAIGAAVTKVAAQ